MSLLDAIFKNAGAELVLADTPIVGNAAIGAGLLYQVNSNDAPITLTLAPTTLAKVAGKRIGVKVFTESSEGEPDVVTVAVPDGMTIEGDDGIASDSSTFTADLGAYREWFCDNAGNWLLVSSAGATIVGDDTAGSIDHPYYEKPSPAGDDDLEGDVATALPAYWTLINHGAWTTPVTPSGPVSYSTAPSSGQIRATPKFQNSRYAIQLENAAGAGFIHRYAEFPTALQIRWRPYYPIGSKYIGAGTSNQPIMLLYLTGEASGIPDLTSNYNYIGIRGNGSDDTVLLRTRSGLSSDADYVLCPAGSVFPPDIELCTIYDGVANSISYYARNAFGYRPLATVPSGVTSPTAGSPGYAYLRCANDTAAGNFSHIFGFWHIRVSDSLVPFE